MTKKDHENFKNSTKCWICRKVYYEGEMKVKDHDHITEKYHGSFHQEGNLNFRLKKKKPQLCFIIYKTMIQILYFKKLENIILN